MYWNSRSLPFFVSVLPPSVFLLYLYQRNAAYLSIWHTLIAIAVFTLGAVILHLVLSRLARSSTAAALINNLLCVLFFTIKAPYDVFNLTVRKNLAVYLCIMILITTIIITFIVRNKNKLQRHIIIKIASVFWLVILALNAAPALRYAIGNHSKYTGDDKNYRAEFNVDSGSPSPNIYWLFMDGMLGFKAMEYLFNDPQPDFTAQLTERGFIINRDAQFEAFHSTAFSIPVLMCPHYYDALFVSELRKLNPDNYYQKTRVRDNTVFGKSAFFARSKNELITAFNQKKEYQTSVIGSGAFYLPPISNNYYTGGKKIIKGDTEVMNDSEKLHFGLTLIHNTTPLSKLHFIFFPLLRVYNNRKLGKLAIPEISALSINFLKEFFGESYQGNDRWYLNALADTMSYPGPKLVIIHDAKAHNPYNTDKQGHLIKGTKQKDMFDPFNYPSQHYFASSIVISYIDFILNTDPQAVIVIQADHGLHNEKTRQLLISEYGKTDKDVRLMQNQTISAVRIPEKWGGLEQPIEPPNITRLLINRFVGENYTFLASEEIIK